MALRSYFYFPETGLNGGTDPLRQLPASLQVRWAVDLLTPTAIVSVRQLQCADPLAGSLRVADKILARKARIGMLADWPG
jgi:hypothetical protein